MYWRNNATHTNRTDLNLISEDQFYEQFTLDEKNKLYDAIGYQENEADPTLPKEVSYQKFK